jgi:DeoR/GlpR family transcriptional regulator of sugar metabolism
VQSPGAGADSEFQSVLFEQPYCRITTVMDRCNVSRPTATSWLNALADNGMLQNVKTGRACSSTVNSCSSSSEEPDGRDKAV